MKKALFFVGMMVISTASLFSMDKNKIDKEIEDLAFTLERSVPLDKQPSPPKLTQEAYKASRQRSGPTGVQKPHGQRDAKAPQRQVRKKLDF